MGSYQTTNIRYHNLWRVQGATVSAERTAFLLKLSILILFSMNSFLPERADTGRDGKELM